MAQNITIQGASYSDVPAVTLPKTGGGNASFFDVSDTTATASDVSTGKYFYDSVGVLTEGTSSGGGSVTQDANGYIVLPATGGGSPVGGLEYESGTWTPVTDVVRGEILFSDSHDEAPIFIQVADAGDATTLTDSSNEMFIYTDLYKINGAGVPYGTSGNYFRYSVISYGFMWNSGSSLNTGVSVTGRNSDDAGDSGSNYPRYYAKEDRFYPYTMDARYWRAGRTYKWTAFWKPTT